MLRFLAVLALTTSAALADGGRIVGQRNFAFEKSSRNLVLQSEAVTSASWSPGGLTAAAPTLTPDSATCPRPGAASTADRVALPDVASAQYSIVTQAVGTLVPGDHYTLTMWMKLVSGSSTVLFALSDFTSAGSVRSSATISSLVWTRVTLSTTAPNGNSRYVLLGTDARPAGTNQGASSATTYDICGIQLERQLRPTSYIPTTTAALSRSARPWR